MQSAAGAQLNTEPSAALAQIVIRRLADGRYRIVCFDDHEVVDELATEDITNLFELTERLHSLGAP